MRRSCIALVAVLLIGTVAGCSGGTRPTGQTQNTMPTNWTTRKKQERPWTTSQTKPTVKEPAPAGPAAMLEAAVKVLNEVRGKANLPPMTLNPSLCRVAQVHAESNANQKMNALTKDLIDQAKVAGYVPSIIGETSGAIQSATAVNIAIILNSPDMTKSLATVPAGAAPGVVYTDLGIGFAAGADGITRVVIIYAAPAKQP